MPLPEITHLQFAVLAQLLGGECSGRDLREYLAREGMNHTRPAFYQLMARLEDAQFVKGDSRTKMVDDVAITERFYIITGGGQRAVQSACDFYAAPKIAFPFGGIIGLGVLS